MHANEIPERDKRRAQRRLVKQFMAAAQVQEGDQVMRYLTGRGLSFPAPFLARALRLEQTTYWISGEDGPVSLGPSSAMLAAIHRLDGELVGLHRTYLDDSRKASFLDPVTGETLPSKKMRAAWPGAIRGGAIRLTAAGPYMVVAEGIETTLGAIQLSGRPGWAALSAGGLSRLQLPLIVRDVLVAADADQAGLQAAECLAERLLAEGRTVRFAAPTSGLDWADVAKEYASGRC